MITLTARTPKQQKPLDRALAKFEKEFRMCDSDNPHQCLVAYNKCQERIVSIRELQGKKAGEPGAFGFEEYIRLREKSGGQGEEIRRLRQQVQKLFGQIAEMSKERDKAKQEAKAAHKNNGVAGVRGRTFWDFFHILPVKEQLLGCLFWSGVILIWVRLNVAPGANPDWGKIIGATMLMVGVTPNLAKLLGMAGWGIGTLCDYIFHYGYIAAIKTGKFLLFGVAVFGLGNVAAQNFGIREIFGLALPPLEWSWEVLVWLGQSLDDPVFVGMVGLVFVLYAGLCWIWWHRPVGILDWANQW